MPNKAVGTSLAGGATILIVWLIGTFGHVQVPAEVASALTTVIAGLTTYLVPGEQGA